MVIPGAAGVASGTGRRALGDLQMVKPFRPSEVVMENKQTENQSPFCITNDLCSEVVFENIPVKCMPWNGKDG